MEGIKLDDYTFEKSKNSNFEKKKKVTLSMPTVILFGIYKARSLYHQSWRNSTIDRIPIGLVVSRKLRVTVVSRKILKYGRVTITFPNIILDGRGLCEFRRMRARVIINAVTCDR